LVVLGVTCHLRCSAFSSISSSPSRGGFCELPVSTSRYRLPPSHPKCPCHIQDIIRSVRDIVCCIPHIFRHPSPWLSTSFIHFSVLSSKDPFASVPSSRWVTSLEKDATRYSVLSPNKITFYLNERNAGVFVSDKLPGVTSQAFQASGKLL